MEILHFTCCGCGNVYEKKERHETANCSVCTHCYEQQIDPQTCIWGGPCVACGTVIRRHPWRAEYWKKVYDMHWYKCGECVEARKRANVKKQYKLITEGRCCHSSCKREKDCQNWSHYSL